MSNLSNAKILSKKVDTLSFLNVRVREADNKGVTYLNIQGSYIPVKKGSAVYEELKFQRNQLIEEINTYSIIKQSDLTAVLPLKSRKSLISYNDDFSNTDLYNSSYADSATIEQHVGL